MFWINTGNDIGEHDDLLARARALIAAGNAASSALRGDGIGRGYDPKAIGWGGDEASQTTLNVAATQPPDDAPEPAGGEEGELDVLAKIRGIAQSILASHQPTEETHAASHDEPMTRESAFADRRTAAGGGGDMDASFGVRLAELSAVGRELGGGEEAGWEQWMEERRLCEEPSTATLPSVLSRGAESDLSAGLPLQANGALDGGEDREEQRVVLQGFRMRGNVCGLRDDPEVSFMIKLDINGIKSRTNKERRLRGEVSSFVFACDVAGIYERVLACTYPQMCVCARVRTHGVRECCLVRVLLCGWQRLSVVTDMKPGGR